MVNYVASYSREHIHGLSTIDQYLNHLNQTMSFTDWNDDLTEGFLQYAYVLYMEMEIKSDSDIRVRAHTVTESE